MTEKSFREASVGCQTYKSHTARWNKTGNTPVPWPLVALGSVQLSPEAERVESAKVPGIDVRVVLGVLRVKVDHLVKGQDLADLRSQPLKGPSLSLDLVDIAKRSIVMLYHGTQRINVKFQALGTARMPVGLAVTTLSRLVCHIDVVDWPLDPSHLTSKAGPERVACLPHCRQTCRRPAVLRYSHCCPRA